MSEGKGQGSEMSFWDHLEELRGVLLHSVSALLILFVVLFFFKGFIFDTVVLGPTRPDFWLYRLLGVDFGVSLINIEVTAQFFIHMRVTLIAAIIVCVPYLIFELWRFVAPALYKSEKRAVRAAFALGSGLFYIGTAVGYFVVMPLVMFFFAGYQVSVAVENTFSLSSYISIFSSMVLVMGILFEFPSVIAVLSRIGIVTRRMLRGFRRHAVVVILILAAVLTPTGDPFTMLVVAAPLYILYEFSILLCKKDVEAAVEGGEK